MEPVQQQQELHLRDYLRLIRKRHRLIIGCVVSVAALAAGVSLISPNVYQAKATVQVQGQSGYIIRATASMDEGGGTLTPTSLSELINSQSYRELATGLLTLSDGYHMDLTARRSQDDMVSLFEEDLMKEGLPTFFGRMALKTSRVGREKLSGMGMGITDQVSEDPSKPSSNSNLARRLSSVEKDEVIKQAGALALLSRRFNIDLFKLKADEIGPKAIQIMNSSLVRELPSHPLNGRRWENLPPLERGALVQSVYRELVKKDPNQQEKREGNESYATGEMKDTGMLNISFESQDKYRAMNGVDAMVCAIVWKNQYARKEAAQRIRQIAEIALFGSDGNGGVRAQLTKVKKQLRDFKNEHKLPDIEAIRNTRASQMARIQSDYQNAIAGVAAAQRQEINLSAQLAQIPRTVKSPTTSENPIVARLKGDLVAAQAELQSSKTLYTDENPGVQAGVAKVARLQNELNAELSRQPRNAAVNESPNPLYGQFYEMLSKVQTDLIGYQQRKKTLEGQLRIAQAQLAKVPNTEYEVSDIIGNQMTLNSYMTDLGGKYLEAQLNEATKTSSARVVDLALEPGKKVKPKRTVNVILGLLLGLFMGLGASVLAETMDTRLRTRDELERALPQVPVLSSIPTFSADHPLVVHEQTRSTVTEAFRRLRSAIRFLGVERPMRTIVITSPAFGEGKSTIAANLAASFAQSGQSVILVDGDLRKPVQHEIMGVDNRAGLTTLLLGDESLSAVLKPTEVDGLSVLTSGPIPPNPTELLDSAAMRSLMAALAEKADVVVFDSSPASVVTDTSILGSLADGVVLVAGGGITSRDSMKEAWETLKQARVRLLGSVLNRADLTDEEGGYQLYERYSENGSGRNGHRKAERRVKTKV